MSGLDLLQAVHAINPETPVILITAFGTIEAAVAALKQGAIDYLTKPLNLDELLHRIRLVSDRYRITHREPRAARSLTGTPSHRRNHRRERADARSPLYGAAGGAE